MDRPDEASTCRFDDFVLDLRGYVLLRLQADGTSIPVPLGSRAFQILSLLIERRPAFVSKQEIMDAVWPNVAVEENNLTVQMSALRRVLDKGRDQGSCIQTIPGRGYRFLPDVVTSGDVTQSGQNAILVSPVDTPAPSLPEAGEQPDTERTQLAPLQRRWLTFMPRAVALCVSIAALVWLYGRYHVEAVERPPLSIVVLPFQNLSGNPAEDYLAEGVTQDLTSDLAHLPGAFVIASASARAYWHDGMDVRQIGRESGTRYAVEGGVSRIGDTLKVNAELVSTQTGAALWSERFDEKFSDLASGQEQILGRMGDGLGVNVVQIEAARVLGERPTKPEAFDLLLRAWSLRNQAATPQSRHMVLALSEQALALDPHSVLALIWTAQMLLNDKMEYGYWPSLATRDRVVALMEQARAIDPNSESLAVLSTFWQESEGRCQDILTVAKQMIEMFPNDKNFYFALGYCKAVTGDAEETIPLMRTAAMLSPRDPVLYINYRRRGFASMLLGRDDDAIDWFERSLAVDPDAPAISRHDTYRMLAAIYARTGREAEARRAAAEADRLWPFDTLRHNWAQGISNPVFVAQWRRYVDGTRLSGERDHADENADFEVPADGILHSSLRGYTPTSAPGATTIRTTDLARLMDARKPVVLDAATVDVSDHSLPGAVRLPDAGLGGSFTDHAQDRLRQKLRELTDGDLGRPIVAVGWNSESFDGRNLALRLVTMGYSHVYWYRGGREAWEVAGLPETPVAVTDWYGPN